jgi:glucosamine-6-phosphate deaminase
MQVFSLHKYSMFNNADIYNKEVNGKMKLSISGSSVEMGQRAADKVTELIRAKIKEQGEARIMVSTGQSQFEFYETLVTKEIPWDKVEIFHLDEYIGLPITHKASFRKYLKERFIDKIANARMNYISGEGDVKNTIAEITEKIKEKPIDIGVIGIGENGHVAFNDPPADFETTASFHVVELDLKCRQQQVGEGWFAAVDGVPKYAISVTVSQIMACEYIVSVVPHKVKAPIIKEILETDEVTNLIPATKLKEHKNWHLYLDADSASLLSDSIKETAE